MEIRSKNVGLWLVATLIIIFFLAIAAAQNQVVKGRADSGLAGTEATQIERVRADQWKTCINEEYGYSVSFPADWYTYGENSYSETTLFQPSECTGNGVLISQYTADEIATGKEPDFMIQYQDESHLGIARYRGVRSLQEYLRRNPNLADDISKYKSVLVDGRNFIWIEGPSLSRYLIGFEEGSLITLRGSSGSSEEVFLEMLSTIRFLKS